MEDRILGPVSALVLVPELALELALVPELALAQVPDSQ
jgi:hypothetical protein